MRRDHAREGRVGTILGSRVRLGLAAGIEAIHTVDQARLSTASKYAATHGGYPETDNRWLSIALSASERSEYLGRFGHAVRRHPGAGFFTIPLLMKIHSEYQAVARSNHIPSTPQTSGK